MTRCSNCHQEIAEEDRFCPHCGAVQPWRPSPQEQPTLPFSPWIPPRLAMQPAGMAATPHTEPYVGPPMSGRQVAIAVSAILCFLLLVMLIGHGGVHGPSVSKPAPPAARKTLPMVGKMNEAVIVGKTAWGVAFTDRAESVDHHPPVRGKFLSVGLIIGNKSESSYYLNDASVGLLDEATGERFTPRATVWGTPSQIIAGHYTNQFSLPPGSAIAGLIVFDVPSNTARPRLLVRDLSTSSPEFTGLIDLSATKSDKVVGKSIVGRRW